MSNYYYQNRLHESDSAEQIFPAPDEFQEIDLPPPPPQFQEQQEDILQQKQIQSNGSLPFSLTNFNNNLLSKLLPTGFNEETLPRAAPPPISPPTATAAANSNGTSVHAQSSLFKNGPVDSTSSSGNATEPTSSSSSRTATPPLSKLSMPTLQHMLPKNPTHTFEIPLRNGPPNEQNGLQIQPARHTGITPNELPNKLADNMQNLNLDAAKSTTEKPTLFVQSTTSSSFNCAAPILSNPTTHVKDNAISNFFNKQANQESSSETEVSKPKTYYGLPPKDNAAGQRLNQRNQENNNYAHFPVFPQRPNVQEALNTEKSTSSINQSVSSLKSPSGPPTIHTSAQTSHLFSGIQSRNEVPHSAPTEQKGVMLPPPSQSPQLPQYQQQPLHAHLDQQHDKQHQQQPHHFQQNAQRPLVQNEPERTIKPEQSANVPPQHKLEAQKQQMAQNENSEQPHTQFYKPQLPPHIAKLQQQQRQFQSTTQNQQYQTHLPNQSAQLSSQQQLPLSAPEQQSPTQQQSFGQIQQQVPCQASPQSHQVQPLSHQQQQQPLQSASESQRQFFSRPQQQQIPTQNPIQKPQLPPPIPQQSQQPPQLASGPQQSVQQQFFSQPQSQIPSQNTSQGQQMPPVGQLQPQQRQPPPFQQPPKSAYEAQRPMQPPLFAQPQQQMPSQVSKNQQLTPLNQQSQQNYPLQQRQSPIVQQPPLLNQQSSQQQFLGQHQRVTSTQAPLSSHQLLQGSQEQNYTQQQQQLQQPPPPNAPGHLRQIQQPVYGQPQSQLRSHAGAFNNDAYKVGADSLKYQAQAAPSLQQQQQQVMTQPYPSGPPVYNQQMSVTHQGFNRLWGQDTIDLMQNRHILSNATLAPPKITLHNEFYESVNCSPNVIRCTLTKIPDSQSLLQKSRLPLGVLIHPFRDINGLPVIQSPTIVRCRVCRTYINPFINFVDSKMWKCNICYRNNELPDDFSFDPMTKTFGDVTRRPEVCSSTIEYIAPSEYMLRPPQPAIYVFLFDVSIIAQQCGYLEAACDLLTHHIGDMPGDARSQVAFICYDSFLHFYSIATGYNQPHEITLVDIEDPFLPRPDTFLVNKKECSELISDLLTQLPTRFANTHDSNSAFGAALQVAYQLIHAYGGRITAFQTCLPNYGPGALQSREDPNFRSAKDIAHLNPATDFYKRYALECAGSQVAVDLFLLNQQYSDLATISGVSKHSGGTVYHFPIYQKTKSHMVDSFKHCFKRYLTRKIGFESVMRIRCTRGLQVHTFHGNFFVRSTDLLSLPNINPDAGFGLQISYDESLSDVKTICFQSALLYTNSEGERRIRVHTLCLPVTTSLPEVMHSADSEAITGLLAKMAVDVSTTSSLSDARDAFVTTTVDVFNAFQIAQNLPSSQSGQLIAPRSLALLPLYVLSLLKHPAFRVGTSTRLDDRVYAMDCMKTLPLDQFMKFIYPEFYRLDDLFTNLHTLNRLETDNEEDVEIELPSLRRLQLSAEHLNSRSIFLMDCGTLIIIYVGLNVPANILDNVFGISSTAELPDYVYEMPIRDTPHNEAVHAFIAQLNEDKPYSPTIQITRDTSTAKPQFIERLIDDRTESTVSYYEFLQSIRAQVK